jgi:hypothetical protein
MSRALARTLLLALLAVVAVLGMTFARNHSARAAELLPPVADATRTCADAGTVAGEAVHHAGLVIDFGGGRTETLCVEFDGEEISGGELLRASGYDVVFSGYGGLGSAVCRIDNTGCSDPGDCFCQCRGADCHYWSYWSYDEGAWHYQNLGLSSRRLYDGDIDGWVWGAPRTPPPQTSGSICPDATPTRPAPSPTPVRTPSPGPAGARETPAVPPPPSAGDTATAYFTPPATQDTTSAAAGTVGPTPEATAQARVISRSQDGGSAPLDPDAARQHGAGGGVPPGLFAFAVVAGAIVVAGGAAVARRRLRG